MDTYTYVQLEHLILNYLDHYKVKFFVLVIIPQLEKNLVVRKVHHLVYLNDLFKESLKVLWLVILKSVLNEVLLTYLSDILKEWKNELYLNWTIAPMKVINYELRWPLLYPSLVA